MAKFNFSGHTAFVFRCPICNDKHIGGGADVDPDTYSWMEVHAKWHEKGNTNTPNQLINLGTLDFINDPRKQ